jgi:hypothetical protein
VHHACACAGRIRTCAHNPGWSSRAACFESMAEDAAAVAALLAGEASTPHERGRQIVPNARFAHALISDAASAGRRVIHKQKRDKQKRDRRHRHGSFMGSSESAERKSLPSESELGSVRRRGEVAGGSVAASCAHTVPGRSTTTTVPSWVSKGMRVRVVGKPGRPTATVIAARDREHVLLRQVRIDSRTPHPIPMRT